MKNLKIILSFSLLFGFNLKSIAQCSVSKGLSGTENTAIIYINGVRNPQLN